MPGIVRTGVDVGDGGDDCDPCPYGQGSTNVFVNAINVIRVGDPLTCGENAASGSNNVFVNFISVHRIGDSTTCGGVAHSGSGNVFANGV